MQFPFPPPLFLCVFMFNSGQEFYIILKDRNKSGMNSQKHGFIYRHSL